MKVKVLGSGTSHGVPMIGCKCDVCKSSNPRNNRMRASITVEKNGQVILVDTTPELRVQSLAFDVNHIDAVFITHLHADHIFGFDDLRRFNHISKQDMPVYSDQKSCDGIRQIFPYIFAPPKQGGGVPKVDLRIVEPRFNLCGLDIRSFYVLHGSLPVLAFRFDDFAYLTDVNSIPPEAMGQLQGLDLLILDCVRFEPHSTHFGLYEALEIVDILKPRQTYFTHLSHAFDHDIVNSTLKPETQLAYDGQIIEL